MNNFRILEMKREQLDKKRTILNKQLDGVMERLNVSIDKNEVIVLGAIVKVLENEFKEVWEQQHQLSNSFEYDAVRKETVWHMENLMIDIEEDEEVEYDEISFRVGDLIGK